MTLQVPADRLAFVLHDLFGVPYEQIASAIGRSSTATRQLTSGLGGQAEPETEDRGMVFRQRLRASAARHGADQDTATGGTSAG